MGQELGQQLGVVAVDDDGHPRGASDLELRVNAPVIGEARALPTALAGDEAGEVSGVLDDIAVDVSRGDQIRRCNPGAGGEVLRTPLKTQVVGAGIGGPFSPRGDVDAVAVLDVGHGFGGQVHG